MGNNITKNCDINCNGDFLEIVTRYGGFFDPEYDPVYLNIRASCKLLGETTKICFDRRNQDLDKNQEENFERYFSRDAHTKRYNDCVKYMMKKFRYKSKKKAFENMMSVGISKKEDEKVKITPTIHVKGDQWNWSRKLGSLSFSPRRDIYVSSDVSFEILGAAVKYAFTLCEGQGSDIVSKALFPDGAPNSFDEYLANIDDDYEKYIIIKPKC